MKRMISFMLLTTLLACGGKGGSKSNSGSIVDQYADNLAPKVGDTSFLIEAGEDHDFIVDRNSNEYKPTIRKIYNTTAQTILKVDGDFITVLVETNINKTSERVVKEIPNDVVSVLKSYESQPNSRIENGYIHWEQKSTYYQKGVHPGEKIPLNSLLKRTISISSRCDYSEELTLTDPKDILPTVTIYKRETCQPSVSATELKKLNSKRYRTCDRNGKCRDENVGEFLGE